MGIRKKMEAKLKSREWFVLLFFLILLLSLVVIAKVSDYKVDREIEQALNN